MVPLELKIEAYQRFYSLYFGELSVVEDEKVCLAMVAFEKELDQKMGNRKLEDALVDIDLTAASLTLAGEIRDSLAQVVQQAEEAVERGEIPTIPKVTACNRRIQN